MWGWLLEALGLALRVVFECVLCLFVEKISAASQKDAQIRAFARGWTYRGGWCCPKCSRG